MVSYQCYKSTKEVIVANIKSAKKRIKVIEKKTMQNKARKTKMKNSIKNVLNVVENGTKQEAMDAFKETEKVIRKTASKGTIHKNNASRKVSRLRNKINAMD